MSKECPLCYQSSDDNAIICGNCGVAFPADESESDKIKKFIVTCPICGKQYDVPSLDSTVEFCDNEEDEFDKYQIKKQKAKVIYVDAEQDDISDDVALGESKPTETLLVLTEVRDGHEIVITKDGGIIGRSGDFDNELFKDNMYISGMHFRVVFENNEWYLEHMSNTNNTFVNGTKLLHDVRFKIKDRDRIVIPELTFRVSFRG